VTGHTARRLRSAVALVGMAVAGTLGASAFASAAVSQSASPLPRTVRSGDGQPGAARSSDIRSGTRASASRASASRAVRITTLTVIPRIQRTARFTGYATYIFSAPKGRRIVSATARIAGAQAHAVAIRRRTISRNRTRYTVNLVFPGEQGNPGRLIVRLGTVA
jgi:hypothetical protein